MLIAHSPWLTLGVTVCAARSVGLDKCIRVDVLTPAPQNVAELGDWASSANHLHEAIEVALTHCMPAVVMSDQDTDAHGGTWGEDGVSVLSGNQPC